MSPTERLAQLGLTLPHPPAAAGAYVATRIAGSLLVVSGQFPLQDGVAAQRGQHARGVFGVATLPRNMPVALDVLADVAT